MMIFDKFFRAALNPAGVIMIAGPGVGLSIYLQQITITNTAGGGNVTIGLNGGGGPFFADMNNTPANSAAQITFPGGLKLGSNNALWVIGVATITMAGSYTVGPA